MIMAKMVKSLLVILILLVSCNQKTNTNSNLKNQETSLAPNPEIKYKPLNPLLNGYSTANAFLFANCSSPELVSLVKDLHPSVLRFPGGAIANLYHPNAKGYGYVDAEISKMKGNPLSRTKQHANMINRMSSNDNFIVDFIKLCKQTNSKVLYVANVVSGTPEETIQALEILKKEKLEIAGIELGTELYANLYSGLTKDINQYIEQITPFSIALRKYDPSLKLSVTAAPTHYQYEGLRQNPIHDNWNTVLAENSNLFDAYVIHLYPLFKSCQSDKNLNSSFECSSNEVYNFFSTSEFEKYFEIYKPFFKETPVWITEWNMGSTAYFGNTFLQSLFHLNFKLELIHLSSSKNYLIELSTFHNLIAKENSYSIITPTWKNQDQMHSEFTPRASYFSAKLLSKLYTTSSFYLGRQLLSEHKIILYGFSVNDQKVCFYLNYGSSDFELPSTLQWGKPSLIEQYTSSKLFEGNGYNATSKISGSIDLEKTSNKTIKSKSYGMIILE